MRPQCDVTLSHRNQIVVMDDYGKGLKQRKTKGYWKYKYYTLYFFDSCRNKQQNEVLSFGM